MNAWELGQNQVGTVAKFLDGNQQVNQRLKDLGFVLGEPIKCLKIPPFGGPKIFQNENGIYSIEKEVARLMEIELA